MTRSTDYDALVVGGGPAGLSGAVALARSLRRVLLVDSGRPRNAPAEGVHNLLGLEGIAPGELVARGRAEAVGYGVEVRDGEVVTARRVDGGFSVDLAEGEPVTARRLLVTTGLVDELPEVDGLRELWGHDVLHCPYCHGYEVRGRAVGILASGPAAMHQVLLFRQLTDDLTLFLHEQPDPDAERLDRLAAAGVSVVRGRVVALETSGGRLAGVRLESGESVARQALVVQPRFRARSAVLTALGAEVAPLEMGGAVVGEHVVTDPTGLTTVPGVWAAGNVTDLTAQVGAAAAAGVRAGAVINADLAAEELGL